MKQLVCKTRKGLNMNVGHLTIERDNSERFSGITFLIHNTLNGRFIRMGESETRYLLESIEQPGVKVSLGVEASPELNDSLKDTLKTKFREWGFIMDDNSANKASSDNSIKKLVLCRFNVEKMLKFIYPVYTKLYSIPGLIALLFLAVFDIGMIVHNLSLMAAAGVQAGSIAVIFGWQDISVIICTIIAMTFFHEFAHASICRRYGGEVKNMGILLYYCIPCFFCDVSSIYSFKNKRQRAMVAVSGVLSNLFIGFLLIFISIILSMKGIVMMGLVYAGLAGIGVGIYNLIPFVKLDGYWLLSSICGMTNLMEKAIITAYTAVFRRDRLSEINGGVLKKGLLTIYGIIALAFSEVFWISTLLAVRNWFSAWAFVYYPIMITVIFLITMDLIKTILYYRQLIKNDFDRILRTV